MTTKSTFLILASALTLSGFTGLASAAVASYSSTFSATSGANSIAGWSSIGTFPTLVERVVSTNDGATLGDLVMGDGALRLSPQNTIANDEAIGYALSGTMGLAEIYRLDLTYFSSFNNYYYMKISLVNLNDNTTLVQSTLTSLANGANQNTFLTYTTTATDLGDMLGIRIDDVSTNPGPARSPTIDFVSFSQIPEPSTLLLGGLGTLGLLRRRRMAV